MDLSSGEVAVDLSPMLIIYKDDRVERLQGLEHVTPSTEVDTKDVEISKEEKETISARIFLPKTTNPDQKLPLLLYFHGGGFCIHTPFTPGFHNYLISLASKANVVAISVHYRRAPEHPLPIAYEDSWNSLKWVASHFNGKGPEEWINHHADLGKVFFAGDSAGANISNRMAIRVGLEGLPGIYLKGIVLVHPYFWGSEPIGSEPTDPAKRLQPELMWRTACPTASGVDHPWINPAKDPERGKLGCERLLICVAEKDIHKERGYYYKELVENSVWSGHMDPVMEAKGEDHVFHLMNPNSENALAMLNRIASFINQD